MPLSSNNQLPLSSDPNLRRLAEATATDTSEANGAFQLNRVQNVPHTPPVGSQVVHNQKLNELLDLQEELGNAFDIGNVGSRLPANPPQPLVWVSASQANKFAFFAKGLNNPVYVDNIKDIKDQIKRTQLVNLLVAEPLPAGKDVQSLRALGQSGISAAIEEFEEKFTKWAGSGRMHSERMNKREQLFSLYKEVYKEAHSQDSAAPFPSANDGVRNGVLANPNPVEGNNDNLRNQKLNELLDLQQELYQNGYHWAGDFKVFSDSSAALVDPKAVAVWPSQSNPGKFGVKIDGKNYLTDSIEQVKNWTMRWFDPRLETASVQPQPQSAQNNREVKGAATQNVLHDDRNRAPKSSQEIASVNIQQPVEVSRAPTARSAAEVIENIKNNRDLSDIAKAFFSPLLVPSVQKIGTVQDDSPIVSGDTDGSTARAILLGIQSGRLSFGPTEEQKLTGQDRLVKLLNAEAKAAKDGKIVGFQENEALQKVLAEIEPCLVYHKGFRPLIFIGDVAHDRFSLYKDVDLRIREKMHENGAIYIFGNHDSHHVIKQFDRGQSGEFAKDEVSDEVWQSHESKVFVNAYYDAPTQTLYIHNGMVGTKENIYTAFGNLENQSASAAELVRAINELKEGRNEYSDSHTDFRPNSSAIERLAKLYNIRIVHGHDGEFAPDAKSQVVSLNSRVRGNGFNGSFAVSAVILGKWSE